MMSPKQMKSSKNISVKKETLLTLQVVVATARNWHKSRANNIFFSRSKLEKSLGRETMISFSGTEWVAICSIYCTRSLFIIHSTLFFSTVCLGIVFSIPHLFSSWWNKRLNVRPQHTKCRRAISFGLKGFRNKNCVSRLLRTARNNKHQHSIESTEDPQYVCSLTMWNIELSDIDNK